MAKELTVVQRCKKNKWGVGTVLKTICTNGVFKTEYYYEITGFGRHDVLAIRANLPDRSTTSEIILPLNNSSYSAWRKLR